MTQLSNTFPRTIGMDLGISKSAYCAVGPDRTRVEEGLIKTTKEAMENYLRSQPASRVVIEASSPSHWVKAVAESCGHEVVVSNPREFRLISESHRKTDRKDARILADFGQIRPDLLHPVNLRGQESQLARATLALRDHVVKQRTRIINLIRSQVRNLGESLDGCKAATFHKTAPERIPSVLEPIVAPLLEVLIKLTESIASYDKQVSRLCKQHEATSILLQVQGVGPVTALSFVTTIEDPARFARSRDVGAYVGLVPKTRSSGSSSPELRISKRGDRQLRRLLVIAATYVLGPRSEESDLKRYGEKIRARGGQTSRAKARIAVARKLSVLLHRLWITGEDYEPLRNSQKSAA